MKRVFIFILMLLLLPQTALAAASEAEAENYIAVACIDTGISTKVIDAEWIVDGRNYVFADKDCEDRIGHGSAVAGLVLSAADCENIRIVPLLCYDRYPSGVSKRADISVVSQAIIDAVDIFGCRVINISMGVAQDNKQLYEAVRYAEDKALL